MRARIGKRYRAKFSIDPDGITVEWLPRAPTRLWPDEMADHRRARDAFLAELARAVGGNVVCAETATGRISVIAPAEDAPQ